MRVLFLTDLHVGADPAGWSQQRRWAGAHNAQMPHLRDWIRTRNIALVGVGGDLTEHGTTGEIETALAGLDSLGPPVLLVLGNHDLAQPDAIGAWERAAAGFPRIALADRSVQLGDWDVVAINHPWAGPAGPKFRWDPGGGGPQAAVGAGQLAFLERALAESATRPALIILHAPLDPLPPRLTGYPQPVHAEPETYVRPLLDLLDRHPRARLVLAGHCHANCATSHGRRMHATSSAFGEAPYEVRLIELGPREVRVTTHPVPMPAHAPTPDPAKNWVLGQPSDRSFTVSAPKEPGRSK